MGKLQVKNRYGVIPTDVLNNKDLSLKARGLFGFIQSKPENWSFSTHRIAAQMVDGITSIKTTLKELELKGYLKRTPIKKQGKYMGYDYTLYEKPLVENPPMENAPVENLSTFSKIEDSKIDIVRKKENNAEQSSAKDITKKKTKAEKDAEPMTLNQFMDKMKESPHKHIRFIGEWADTVKPDCRTKGQWRVFMERHLKGASKLSTYTDDQIAYGYTQAMKASKNGENFKVTPETIIKYLT